MASKSDELAARRRAAQKVQGHLEAQAQQLTEAVSAVMAAATRRDELTSELEAAGEQLRTSVAALAKLGLSSEEIADLCELPLADVRSARRTRKDRQGGSPAGESGAGSADSAGSESVRSESVRSEAGSEQSKLAE